MSAADRPLRLLSVVELNSYVAAFCFLVVATPKLSAMGHRIRHTKPAQVVPAAGMTYNQLRGKPIDGQAAEPRKLFFDATTWV
jgi:hypothetical protein